jgi:hypothetical protein
VQYSTIQYSTIHSTVQSIDCRRQLLNADVDVPARRESAPCARLYRAEPALAVNRARRRTDCRCTATTWRKVQLWRWMAPPPPPPQAWTVSMSKKAASLGHRLRFPRQHPPRFALPQNIAEPSGPARLTLPVRASFEGPHANSTVSSSLGGAGASWNLHSCWWCLRYCHTCYGSTATTSWWMEYVV